MSDTTVVARSVQFFTEQSPSVAQAEVLGRVPEGADTAQVVYRMHMTAMGTPVSRTDVLSFARSGGEWRGRLKGDVAAMANALQRAFGGR